MGILNLEIRCVLAFSTKIEGTWPFLKIMRRNNPDYLAHNEGITDRSGNPYQYFHYSAWGESFAQAEATQGSFSSTNRLNAKELDQETGNYYYGARYYHPKWGVWLAVDPLAGESPNQTPYHFVSNNPVMRIDPDGLTDYLNESGDIIGTDEVLNGKTMLIKSNLSKTQINSITSFLSANNGNVDAISQNQEIADGFIDITMPKETREDMMSIVSQDDGWGGRIP